MVSVEEHEEPADTGEQTLWLKVSTVKSGLHFKPKAFCLFVTCTYVYNSRGGGHMVAQYRGVVHASRLRNDYHGHLFNISGHTGSHAAPSFVLVRHHSSTFAGHDHVDSLLSVGNGIDFNCTHIQLRYLAFLVQLATL